MSSVTINGTVTDSSGASGTFSVVVTLDQVTITSAVVVPSVAPAGANRTLTVVAQSAANLAMTATVNPVTGVTFAPVTGQPAGQFQWTFVL